MTSMQQADALISASASMLTIQDAVLDSPIYRANIAHIEDQVDQIQLWLEGLTKQLRLYLDELNKFNLTTNALCKKAIPQGVDESLLDSDFSNSIIRAFTDALQTSLAFKTKLVNDIEDGILQPLTQFLKTEVKEFKEYRKQMERQLSMYESQLARYSTLSKTKESSALREDAFQLHEVRKSYVRMCDNYVIQVIAFRTYLDRALVTSFTNATVAQVEELEGASEIWTRLKSSIGAWKRWLVENRQTCDYQLQKLQKSRKHIESSYLKRVRPSRDLEHYSSPISVPSGSGAVASLMAFSPGGTAQSIDKEKMSEMIEKSSKQGYLFNRIIVGKPARFSWTRKWFFLHNGWFGSCAVGTVNKIKGSITVNDRVSVLLCDIKVVNDLDRRFCFEIVCAQHPSFMLQAETDEEMQSWIQSFNYSKRLALDDAYGESSSQNDQTVEDEKSDSASKRLSLVSSKAKSTTVVTTDASFPTTATSTTVLPSGETSTTTSIVTPSIQSSNVVSRSSGKSAMSTHSLTTSSSLTSLLVRDVSKDSLHKTPVTSPIVNQSTPTAAATIPVTGSSKEDDSNGLPANGPDVTSHEITPNHSTWGIPWALVPGINMFSGGAEGSADGGVGAPADNKPLVVWPAHIEAEVEKVALNGYDSAMETKNHELRRLFGGVAPEEVVIDAFPASLHRPAAVEKEEEPHDDTPSTPMTPNIPEFPLIDSEVQELPLSNFGHAYTGRAFLTQETFWFYSCMMMTCVNTIAVKLKDIQSVKLVRDPSVAGHGSGSKDDIALAITIKEEGGSSQFVLKTLMQDVEALAERLRLAIDNTKSGHSMPLQDLFDIIQNISVSRSNPSSSQPTTIITTAAKSQAKASAEASPGEKTPPKDKKSKKAPRKSSSGSKAPPMPATSGALAAAMMAATAVAGGSKFFDDATHKKPEDHSVPSQTSAAPTNDSGVNEASADITTDEELPANFKEPASPISCDCKDHLDKLEGEIELPISAKKLFTYLFSEEKTGPAENGGVWNKMNTSKGNSGLSITKWNNNGEGKPERVLKYIMPVNNPMVKVKETEVVETQNIVKQDEHLCYVVTASTKTAQLPYADAFLPCLRFCITWVSKNRCRLQCHIGVKWLKSIMVKSMVNKAALKGMSDTIAALLPIIREDVSKLGYPAGKAPEADEVANKAAAAADSEKAEKAKANEIGANAKAPERGLLSWISKLYNLTTLQILLVAICLTLLIWHLQVSTPSDEDTTSEHVVHSRAVYLKDIEKELIDSKASLTTSKSVEKFMESRPSLATTLNMNSTVAKQPSGWFASYHRHFAYDILFTRERIGLLRYDVMVMFQSLNNIEKRLLETEYVNWLLDGKLRCAAGETQHENAISCQTNYLSASARTFPAAGAKMKEMPSNQLSNTEKENLEQIPGSEWQYTTIHFFQEASIMLDLPTKTAATAIMYHHKFKQFMADVKTNPIKEINGHQVDVKLALDCDDELLATTCLHLACKATEVVRKLRDVINVCYRLIHQSDPILEIDEYYYNLRTSLTTSELILIRALGYNLDVDLPFAFALKVLKGMGCVPVFTEDEDDEQRWQKEILPNGTSRSAGNSEYPDKQRLQVAVTKYFEDLDVDLALVARLTWIYAWDSMCHPSVALEHDSYSIALACIYLAVRSAGASLPMDLVAWVHFWGDAHNVTIKSMKNALTSLMEELAVVKA